jgi:Chaperone of endosialidase
MGKPDAPTPPDPRQTSAASTSTNVGTAIANAVLGNVNQNTPTGSLQFNATENYTWTDPYTGSTYTIPQFTATQTLSDEQQAIQDQLFAAQYNMAGLGNQQSAALAQHLASPFDISGAPSFGDPTLGGGQWNADWRIGDVGAMQRNFADVGQAQREFGDAGEITRTYEDFAGQRERIEAGLMERLNPQLGNERSRYEQQLANQGIRYGSPAYTNAMDNYNRMANDARLGVIGAAGNEQTRMANLAAQRAGFQNAAQQQQYAQNLGRGQFYNQGQQQAYEQALGRAQFGNQTQQALFQQALARGTFANNAQAQNFAQAQGIFNAQNVARQQYLNEMFQMRNQPINEVTALLSGSQVTNPNFVNAQMPRIPTTDVAGIINQNFAQQMGIYQQQSQNANQLMGGVLGLAGGILRSDRRVKEDIHKIGSVLTIANENKRLPIYSYNYKDDPTDTPRVGPMAQDVEKIDRGAVRSIGGVKHIDVDRLGSILAA